MNAEQIGDTMSKTYVGLRVIGMLLVCIAVTEGAPEESANPKAPGFALGQTGLRARALLGLGVTMGGDTLVEGTTATLDPRSGRIMSTDDFKIKPASECTLKWA